ncbi:MAG: hypothetical protein AB7U75_21365 [Hyphomicrobiaceae bacterium]
MDRAQDDFDFFPPQDEHDVPLSARWAGVTDDDILNAGLGGLSPHMREVVRYTFACLVMAATVDKWVSFSLNRSFYGPWCKFYEGRHFSYANHRQVMEILDAAGLIILEKQKPFGFDWQSRMRASQKLLALAQSWGQILPSPGRLICLKGEKGKKKKASLIVYEETEETRRMRIQMEAVNESIASVVIDAPRDVLDMSAPIARVGKSIVVPSRRTLVRIFSETFQRGGRLYRGFWQSLPGEVRALLLLDGEEVAEPDYRQIHAQLLYALLDRSLVGDAYTLEGIDRRVGKICFQILLNSQSRDGAIAALVKEVYALDDQALASGFGKAEAAVVINAMKKRHARVRSAFHKGIGLTLQFIDSELMLAVIERCRAVGIVGLPVHDSLIVKRCHLAKVEEIMEEELQRMIGKLRARQFTCGWP